MSEKYLTLAEIDIQKIQNLCRNEAIRWTNHIHVRLQQRGISIDDILAAIMNGEIIEQYPTDYPFPSCLLLGLSFDKKPLHIVCGIGTGVLWLITAYRPNLNEWTQNFMIRKENSQ